MRDSATVRDAHRAARMEMIRASLRDHAGVLEGSAPYRDSVRPASELVMLDDLARVELACSARAWDVDLTAISDIRGLTYEVAT